MSSPTQRTKSELKKLGAMVQVVEHWNAFARRRIDLFGVIDVVAILGPNLIGIQTCAGDSHANRKAKILAEPRALAWVKTGALLELWSWSKRGGRGERKLWTLRKEEIVLGDFPQP